MDKTAIQRAKMQQTDPNAFPYYLRWDVKGHKGHYCRILKAGVRTAHVLFEDGDDHIVNRASLRRRKEVPC
jgi:hypothetical protein